MIRWLGPDESRAVGPYVVRRAQPGDAHAYSLADAQMVGETYAATMPPEFAEARLAEVDALAVEREAQFAEALAVERAGGEPARRAWVAMQGTEIAGIAVSTCVRPTWEEELGATTLPGISYQLNHLYLRREAHGTGLAQAMLDVALPHGMPAYLWIVGGNHRAERFYARNRFVREDATYTCGPLWFQRPLFRMLRR
jgi:GNAT superfamily N-acetyltransferase